jgi:hypothetical protein
VHHRQPPWASVTERPVCSRMKKGDAVPQSYSRYYARDFEQRWRKRLDMTSPGWPTGNDTELHVKVTHRFPAPKPYGWELRPASGLPAEESRVQFGSWEEASQAGKLALRRFSD